MAGTTSEMNEKNLTSVEEFMAVVDQECAAGMASGIEFNPRPIYDPKDDCLIFHAKMGFPKRKRVNSLLTLYLDASDRSLIGCEVKSVSRLLKLKKSFGLIVADKKLVLGVFLMLALAPTVAEDGEDDELEQYEDGLESYKDVEIEDDALACVAC